MEDNTQLAKDEFSKYFNGKNEVVLNIGDTLYFEKKVNIKTTEKMEKNRNNLVKIGKKGYDLCMNTKV